MANEFGVDLPGVKQPFYAALLFVALPAFAHAQDSAPVTLEDSLICGHRGTHKASCITPPRQIYSPDPKFPKSEQHVSREGAVKVKLVVRSDGVPTDVTISRSLNPDFDNAAIDAVKQWKFSPAIKNGAPIAVQIAIEVQFHLTGRDSRR
jgi:TonB family protein